ncbi:MAG: hypothetical protein WA957_03945 [Alteraurantiacibacter sp.]
MMKASTPPFAAIAKRLAGRARASAEALAENALRARRQDPQRWRDARLLWPNSTREP